MKKGDKFIIPEDEFIGTSCKAGTIATLTSNLCVDTDGYRFTTEETRHIAGGWGMLRSDIEEYGITPLGVQGTKHDSEKNRIELIPYEAIEQIGLALTFGAKKYDDNNWRQGFKYSRLTGALLRHTFAWAAGQDKDPESGLSHLAHAGACLSFLIAHEQLGYGEDDRVKTKS